ncbi:transposase family protein [Actinomadura darangshiensis]|uniref:transposase family protein n=1 Tax=Actinomadura darangshiensis TaxID=705336 RepID=UPI001A9DFF28
MEVLDRIPDPRRRRGRRYRLGPMLALCLVAVLSGATSLAKIDRITAELDARVLADLRLPSARPVVTTLGRLLGSTATPSTGRDETRRSERICRPWPTTPTRGTRPHRRRCRWTARRCGAAAARTGR